MSNDSHDSIVISLPCSSLSTITSFFDHEVSVPWLYLGKDYFKKSWLEKKLGSKYFLIDIAKLLDQVAKEIRNDHVSWIDELNKINGQNIDWWFASISSRNIYCSNLFQYCCYLEVLKRLWIYQGIRPRLLFVESIGLSKVIQKWAFNKGIITYVVNQHIVLLKRISNCFYLIMRYVNFIITLILKWLAAFITRLGSIPNQERGDLFAIIDTFIHENSLSEDGTFKDRYYPHLHEYLGERGLYSLIHPVLHGFRFNYFSIYQRMRRSKSHFIIPEDYLGILDYLWIISHPLRVLRTEVVMVRFREHDLENITNEEKWITACSGLQAALIYRLFIKLGRSDMRPKIVINWYENQVIDKALIAGARKAFPRAKIIGAQMFIHSPNHLNLFPCQSEVNASIIPDMLLETSEYQCNVAASFCKNITCRPAAALRYAHLFNDMQGDVTEFDTSVVNILILLPFDVVESIEMLDVIKKAIYYLEENIKFIIKIHPDNSPEFLLKFFGAHGFPPQFEIFYGSLPEALQTASMVISSNSSSMVEAAVYGLPIIFLSQQTVLNQNLLTNMKHTKIVMECFSVSDLIVSIKKYISLSKEEKKEYISIGKNIRDIFFTEINEETMKAFIDQDITSIANEENNNYVSGKVI
jgi:surface carbohydrate biosynthesis protein (TIGR04326 family)